MYKFALELLNKYLLNQWERIMKYFPFFTGLNIGMISLVFEKHVLRPYQIIGVKYFILYYMYKFL